MLFYNPLQHSHATHLQASIAAFQELLLPILRMAASPYFRDSLFQHLVNPFYMVRRGGESCSCCTFHGHGLHTQRGHMMMTYIPSSFLGCMF